MGSEADFGIDLASMNSPYGVAALAGARQTLSNSSEAYSTSQKKGRLVALCLLYLSKSEHHTRLFALCCCVYATLACVFTRVTKFGVCVYARYEIPSRTGLGTRRNNAFSI